MDALFLDVCQLKYYNILFISVSSIVITIYYNLLMVLIVWFHHYTIEKVILYKI